MKKTERECRIRQENLKIVILLTPPIIVSTLFGVDTKEIFRKLLEDRTPRMNAVPSRYSLSWIISSETSVRRCTTTNHTVPPSAMSIQNPSKHTLK